MTRRGTVSTNEPSAATAAGGKRYRERHATRFTEDFFRPFAGNLVASSIGIGTYLGECDDADDASYAIALRASLERGMNLVDTSVNYRCQRSERVVGKVLRDAIADGVVARDEVIVCTKGGY